MRSRKNREGIVYSTNPEFKFEGNAQEGSETLPPAAQLLYVWLDSKSRKGKTVTLVKGFKGSGDDLEALGRKLKTHCGTGGSVKDGEIIVQGDFREKVVALLSKDGYKVKRAGG